MAASHIGKYPCETTHMLYRIHPARKTSSGSMAVPRASAIAIVRALDWQRLIH